MLGRSPESTYIHPVKPSKARETESRLEHGPIGITEIGLTEFLNAPRRARLTKAHEWASLSPFEIVARSKGELILSNWLEDMSPFRAIHELQSKANSVDLIQLSLVTGRIPLRPDRWRETLNTKRNGRYGLEVTFNGTKHCVSPLNTIASNQSLQQWFTELLEEKRITDERFFAVGGQATLLECRQFILQIGKPAKAVETYRGSPLVPTDLPAKKLTDKVISGVARWFMSNQDEDGALPYKYDPSSDTYSSTDNPIRRFMASIAFNRMAQTLDRQDMKVAARKNLDFNLRRFYRVENGKGMITWQGSVKLGSLALAALAIIESPFAEKWKDELSALRCTIDGLWQSSGAFRTFLYPADRNDNQNFYPGETLLFWATSLQQKPDPDLLERALKSISYYRRYFWKDPNPAFVPWHTQAATLLFRLTGNSSLRDYVFEINDWLLPHQQWGGSLDSDYWGRFYSPDKPYGKPHASATGVYLEGLVDALVLAREIGDEIRAESYDRAMQRGIRSMAQLQFHDEIDAYYVRRKERVIGAVRTESADNEIRIDNLQHGLMALLKYRDICQETNHNIVRSETTPSSLLVNSV
jgi:hypothetical protein